jgi:hypothetical protein
MSEHRTVTCWRGGDPAKSRSDFVGCRCAAHQSDERSREEQEA